MSVLSLLRFRTLFFSLFLLYSTRHAIGTAGGGGYVGPSCAVADDRLYQHGVYIRRLDAKELRAFHAYQSALDVWRQLSDALQRGAASVAPRNATRLLTPPRMPSFCNGLDDIVEIVLNGCTVRNNKVYVADQFVRPLSITERAKIEALIGSNQKRNDETQKTSHKLRHMSPIFDVTGTASFRNFAPDGELNLNDPLLLRLLYSLAAQQHSVNEIVEKKRQFFQQFNGPVEPHQTTTNQQNHGNEQLRIGDKILIGGQTYVAVPLSSFATSNSRFGLGTSRPFNGSVPTLGLMPLEALSSFAASEPSTQQPHIPGETQHQQVKIQYGVGSGVLPLVNEIPKISGNDIYSNVAELRHGNFHHFPNHHHYHHQYYQNRNIESDLPHEICRQPITDEPEA